MKRFLIIMSLLGVVFQSVGLELADSLKSMVSTYASEIENCEVDELDISSLSSVKNICKSLIDSEVCAEVEPGYLIDCDSISSYNNKVSIQKSSDDLWGCIFGMMHTVRDWWKGLLVFFKMMAAYPADWFGSDATWAEEAVGNAKSSWNYYVAEGERILEEEDVLMSFIETTIIDPLKEEYHEWSCLTDKGKGAKVCHVLSVILLVVTGSPLVTTGPLVTGATGSVVLGGAALSAHVIKRIIKPSKNLKAKRLKRKEARLSEREREIQLREREREIQLREKE